MKKIIIIILFTPLMIQSCGSHSLDRAALIPVSQEQYIKDKKQTEYYVLNNIEYYRLNPYVCDSLYVDYANFFEPYSYFYNKKTDEYVIAPIPASQYLTIMVDTIIYNSSGLKCFIFCGIRLNIINSDTLMTRGSGRNCDAKSFIGVRSDLTDSLTIYPFVKYSIFGYSDLKESCRDLEYLYFNRLKGEYLSASHYTKNVFEQNVNDYKFFENSIIFQKYNDNTFNYEYCYYNLIRYPYMK